MKKIIITAFLCLSLLLFSGCSFTNQNNNSQDLEKESELKTITQYFTDGNGSEQSPFKIYNVSELQNVATLVNEGITFSQIHIELKNDIDCQNIDWMPIGGCTYNYYFQGVFNGNGFTIKNINIYDCKYPTYSDSDKKVVLYHIGLFGQTKDAEIKNLYVENINISPKSYTIGQNGTNARIGGLIGLARNTKIENCHIKSIEVSFKMSLYQYMCVGGLIGQSWSNTVCTTTTNCNVDVRAGGVDCGGFIGSSSGDNVSYCFSQGNIEVLSNDYSGCNVGGFIGKLSYSRSQSTYNEIAKEYTEYRYLDSVFKECFSSININASAGYYAAVSSGYPDCMVGGFIGRIGETNRTINVIHIYDIGTLSKCFATGNISVNAHDYSIGGFIGNSPVQIPNSNYCINEQQFLYMDIRPIQGNTLCTTISKSKLIEFITNNWNSEMWEIGTLEYPILK
ncbi:MAG: hypothetical protein K2M17_05115 [Bacilli bacterium]|nr:hypothetical protein [Bacilli bacterium]